LDSTSNTYSEEYIQARIFYEFEKKFLAFFENIYFFSDKDYECDTLIFEEKNKKTICTEFEVKLDHSDFLKDFNKEIKHSNYKKREKCPNYFYYICPPNAIKKEEVPEYAGLMEVNETKIRILKRAPLLTEEDIDFKDAYRKAYNKYFEFRKKDYKKVLKSGPNPRRRRKTYRRKRK